MRALPLLCCLLLAMPSAALFGMTPAAIPAVPPQSPAAQAAPATKSAIPFDALGKQPDLTPPRDAAPNPDETVEDRCHRAASREYDGILSDTGVDFKDFAARTAKIVRDNWIPLMPKEVYAPFHKQGSVKICVAVLLNGHIEPHSMLLIHPSGDEALDRAAWGAIQNAVCPPLPSGFKGPRIVMLYRFEYNPTRPRRELPATPNPLGLTLGYTSKL